ncbi:MAG TPA: YciI family protein [Patescibacteria group bacterium]|nr:YciI family protein [Patescibacteria group bacterium]
MPPDADIDADIEAQRAALVPREFDSHTLILLRWADDQPDLSEDALDRLQVEHLRYLKERMDEGVLLANGPLRDQTAPRFRGISIYALPLDEALAIANQDPMVRAGWFAIEGARWTLARGSAWFGRPAVDSVADRSSSR